MIDTEVTIGIRRIIYAGMPLLHGFSAAAMLKATRRDRSGAVFLV
jgi:hypothetical protein